MRKRFSPVFACAILLTLVTILPACKKDKAETPQGWQAKTTDKIIFSSKEEWGVTIIYLVDINGIFDLFQCPANGDVSALEMSADGSKIIFSMHSYNGTDHMYETNLSGHTTTAINNILEGEYSRPVWSQNGMKVAISHGDSICTINPDGTGYDVPGTGYNPSWSPDGTKLCFDTGDSVNIMNADGSGISKLAAGLYSFWTPDGQSIVYYFIQAAWRIGISGGTPTKLVDLPVYGGACIWSPDRTKLLYVDNGLFVLGTNGSAPKIICTPETYGSIVSPRWSPDGTQIVFGLKNSLDAVTIYIANADGSGMFEISKPKGWCYHIDWN